MYIFTYIFRRGNTPLAPPGQHLWTRCIYHIYLLGGATPPLRSVCNTLPGESVGRLFELFLRNQTGVFAEGRKNKCLGAYIVTSNVFLSMLYPDQLRHLRQQKSHHPYIRKRNRPQMTQHMFTRTVEMVTHRCHCWTFCVWCCKHVQVLL